MRIFGELCGSIVIEMLGLLRMPLWWIMLTLCLLAQEEKETDRQAGRQAGRRTDRQAGRQADGGQTDGRTDGRTGRDRQTDRARDRKRQRDGCRQWNMEPTRLQK